MRGLRSHSFLVMQRIIAAPLVDERHIDQKFQDVLQIIADCSDVIVKAPYGVQSEVGVHLLSEQFHA